MAFCISWKAVFIGGKKAGVSVLKLSYSYNRGELEIMTEHLGIYCCGQ